MDKMDSNASLNGAWELRVVYNGMEVKGPRITQGFYFELCK